jgi:hypothetical protein
VDLERLRQAADEAGWLVARGYPAPEVAAFVAQHRRLDPEQQALLACATRLRSEYAKHIARELEPEDVARRPLRIDASSVLAALDAALSGRPLLESPAGVIADPRWLRFDHDLSDPLAALELAQTALKALRPSLVRWYVDESASWSDAVAAALQKIKRPKTELLRVENAAHALSASAYVASSDPEILDSAACWLNLVARGVSRSEATILLLEG